MTPLIGITGRRKKGREIPSLRGATFDLDLDLYFASYATAVAEAKGNPVFISFDSDVQSIVAKLDGLLLSGGADIEPDRYGALPDGLGEYEPFRDDFEFRLLGEAVRQGKPILGICRGLQLINVFLGGTLYQHVPAHAFFDDDPTRRVHEVEIAEGSVLSDYYPEIIKVNSLHHQMVKELASDLQATARDLDGYVEAVQTADRKIVAVQWHPELHGEYEPLFDWLIAEASKSPL